MYRSLCHSLNDLMCVLAPDYNIQFPYKYLAALTQPALVISMLEFYEESQSKSLRD